MDEDLRGGIRRLLQTLPVSADAKQRVETFLERRLSAERSGWSERLQSAANEMERQRQRQQKLWFALDELDASLLRAIEPSMRAASAFRAVDARDAHSCTLNRLQRDCQVLIKENTILRKQKKLITDSLQRVTNSEHTDPLVLLRMLMAKGGHDEAAASISRLNEESDENDDLFQSIEERGEPTTCTTRQNGIARAKSVRTSNVVEFVDHLDKERLRRDEVAGTKNYSFGKCNQYLIDRNVKCTERDSFGIRNGNLPMTPSEQCSLFESESSKYSTADQSDLTDRVAADDRGDGSLECVYKKYLGKYCEKEAVNCADDPEDYSMLPEVTAQTVATTSGRVMRSEHGEDQMMVDEVSEEKIVETDFPSAEYRQSGYRNEKYKGNTESKSVGTEHESTVSDVVQLQLQLQREAILTEDAAAAGGLKSGTNKRIYSNERAFNSKDVAYNKHDTNLLFDPSNGSNVRHVSKRNKPPQPSPQVRKIRQGKEFSLPALNSQDLKLEGRATGKCLRCHVGFRPADNHRLDACRYHPEVKNKICIKDFSGRSTTVYLWSCCCQKPDAPGCMTGLHI